MKKHGFQQKKFYRRLGSVSTQKLKSRQNHCTEDREPGGQNPSSKTGVDIVIALRRRSPRRLLISSHL
jgi:hypothetical protein